MNFFLVSVGLAAANWICVVWGHDPRHAADSLTRRITGEACTSSLNCNNRAVCMALATKCDGRKMCVCKPGFMAERTECRPAKKLGEACNRRLDTCEAPHSECRENSCQCAPMYGIRAYNGTQECRHIVLGAYCTSSSNCLSEEFACVSGQCRCASSFKLDKGYCVEKELGDRCSSTSDCVFIQNSECHTRSSRCVCQRTHVQILQSFVSGPWDLSAKGFCVPLYSFGYPFSNIGEECSTVDNSKVCYPGLTCLKCTESSPLTCGELSPELFQASHTTTQATTPSRRRRTTRQTWPPRRKSSTTRKPVVVIRTDYTEKPDTTAATTTDAICVIVDYYGNEFDAPCAYYEDQGANAYSDYGVIDAASSCWSSSVLLTASFFLAMALRTRC